MSYGAVAGTCQWNRPLFTWPLLAAPPFSYCSYSTTDVSATYRNSTFEWASPIRHPTSHNTQLGGGEEKQQTCFYGLSFLQLWVSCTLWCTDVPRSCLAGTGAKTAGQYLQQRDSEPRRNHPPTFLPNNRPKWKLSWSLIETYSRAAISAPAAKELLHSVFSFWSPSSSVAICALHRSRGEGEPMAQLGQCQVRWVTSSIHCAVCHWGQDIISTEPMTSSSSQFIYQSGDIMHRESIFFSRCSCLIVCFAVITSIITLLKWLLHLSQWARCKND